MILHWPIWPKPVTMTAKDIKMKVLAENLTIKTKYADLLKEVGEPVYQVCKSDSISLSAAWIDVTEQTYNDSGLYPEYGRRILYTSDQLATAILKATKPLEDEIVKWREASRVKHLEAIDWAGKHQAISHQLAAVQEENGRLENQVLARDAELWGRTQEILELNDQLAKAEQLWQVAQGRCDGLEEKLAKAEQRVAEACALYIHSTKGAVGSINMAEAVLSGEWRKFVKEV